MLYVVSTPIGNLKDISFRAVEILKSVDVILCEDTRVSKTLLNHYEIDRPLKSIHKFNEQSEIAFLVEELLKGKNVALISDAGTPLVSDPGELLVSACIENNIQVTPIPGASALIAALSCSGLPVIPFQFLGFIPKKSQERRVFLFQALTYAGTSITYESPERIVETLEKIHEIDSDRIVVIGREITKKFETFYRGRASIIRQQLLENPPRGEIVLLISPSDSFHDALTNVDSKNLVEYLEDKLSLDRKEAIRLAADLSLKDRRAIYKELIPD